VLQTAETTPARTAVRTLKVDHLPLGVVCDGHVEGADWTTILPNAAVGHFTGKVDILSQGVSDTVLVLGLPASDNCG